MVVNYAAAAQRKQEDVPLRAVRLDSLVVLKIMKHCRECMPALVTGQLLGLDVAETLEVTDCFPFPNRSEEEDGLDGDGASFQLDMMRCLREVNADANTVGWYQATLMGSFQTRELIETFVNYAESIKRNICITYDPQSSAAGGLALKAVRLSDSFMRVYKAGNITMEKVKAAGVAWQDIFEEIPISVHSSNLASAVLAGLVPAGGAGAADFRPLAFAQAPQQAKTLDFVNDCLDDVVQEQQKVSNYHRNAARQQQQAAQWLQRRRAENVQRRLAGEEPLPEEDPAFKPLPEVDPLDSLLLTNQVANHCERLGQISLQALEKLQVAAALQRHPPAGPAA